jgi:hypothetical protein
MSLVYAARDFIFYDDVNFIKKGWINRNQVLVNGQPYKFTIPLIGASQNLKINEIKTSERQKFKIKFLKTLNSAYKSAPFKNITLDYVEKVLSHETDKISILAASSIVYFFDYIGIKKNFFVASALKETHKELAGKKRLIELTKSQGSNCYINSIGGISLYSKEEFLNEGIELYFIKQNYRNYEQAGIPSAKFIEGLSIIDVMMNQHPDQIRSSLHDFEVF